MSEEFKVEIVNPEKSFLVKEDVLEVIVPAFEGEMGILKDHISIISFLNIDLSGEIISTINFSAIICFLLLIFLLSQQLRLCHQPYRRQFLVNDRTLLYKLHQNLLS